MRKPLRTFEVTVSRTEIEWAAFTVQAENVERARRKAAYKASNGHVTDWEDVGGTVVVTSLSEVTP